MASSPSSTIPPAKPGHQHVISVTNAAFVRGTVDKDGERMKRSAKSVATVRRASKQADANRYAIVGSGRDGSDKSINRFVANGLHKPLS